MISNWLDMTYQEKYESIDEYLKLIDVDHTARDVAHIMMDIESISLKDDVPF